MRETPGSIAFLLFITVIMMPPAGLWIILRYITGNRRKTNDMHGRLLFINQLASECAVILTFTAFIQVGLYVFTVTKGPHLIDFLDVIY